MKMVEELIKVTKTPKNIIKEEVKKVIYLAKWNLLNVSLQMDFPKMQKQMILK
jgi:hypothetical protein